MNYLHLSRCFPVIAGLAMSGALQAQPIYKCVDPRGVTTISNVRSAGNCEVISSSPAQRSGAVQEMRGAATSAPTPAPATATPTPPAFPRVSGDTQRSRDMDRRLILEQELAAEQRNLDLARRDAAGRDRAAQHERNIQAIQKELSGMR